MKIEIVFLLLLIITKTLSFEDLLITDELEPQYRSLRPLKNKIKRAKSRIVYYSNTVATYNVILSGDIETNPGPGLRSRNKLPKCTVCWKGVGANRKRFECERCLNLTHINCTNISKSQQKQYTAKSTYKWTCYDCTLSLLPFYKQRDVESEPSIEDDFLNTHKNNLLNNKHLLKILHLNCQSLASTFTEFEAMNYECNFDILKLSETWLTENQNLLDYVELSEYDLYYNNRDNKRGGGVAAYVRESLKCKIRKDFYSLDTNIEHLWLELQGKNRHCHLLIGVFYQSNFETKSKLEWLKKLWFITFHLNGMAYY